MAAIAALVIASILGATAFAKELRAPEMGVSGSMDEFWAALSQDDVKNEAKLKNRLAEMIEASEEKRPAGFARENISESLAPAIAETVKSAFETNPGNCKLIFCLRSAFLGGRDIDTVRMQRKPYEVPSTEIGLQDIKESLEKSLDGQAEKDIVVIRCEFKLVSGRRALYTESEQRAKKKLLAEYAIQCPDGKDSIIITGRFELNEKRRDKLAAFAKFAESLKIDEAEEVAAGLPGKP